VHGVAADGAGVPREGVEVHHVRVRALDRGRVADAPGKLAGLDVPLVARHAEHAAVAALGEAGDALERLDRAQRHEEGRLLAAGAEGRGVLAEDAVEGRPVAAVPRDALGERGVGEGLPRPPDERRVVEREVVVRSSALAGGGAHHGDEALLERAVGVDAEGVLLEDAEDVVGDDRDGVDHLARAQDRARVPQRDLVVRHARVDDRAVEGSGGEPRLELGVVDWRGCVGVRGGAGRRRRR